MIIKKCTLFITWQWHRWSLPFNYIVIAILIKKNLNYATVALSHQISFSTCPEATIKSSKPYQLSVGNMPQVNKHR